MKLNEYTQAIERKYLKEGCDTRVSPRSTSPRKRKMNEDALRSSNEATEQFDRLYKAIKNTKSESLQIQYWLKDFIDEFYRSVDVKKLNEIYSDFIQANRLIDKAESSAKFGCGKVNESYGRKKTNESIAVDDMFGASYQYGLESVIDVLNAELGLNLSYRDDWEAVHNICDTFGIKFDENGNILRESYKHLLNSKKLNEDRHDDRRVREYLSELLYGIKDSGLQELVRNIIFSYASSMDWDYVVDLIIKYMPECTLELKDLGIIDESYKINESSSKEVVDLTGYEECNSSVDGFNIYRKRITDKNGKLIRAEWAAQDFGENEKPFRITYKQAIGEEPIVDSPTKRLRKDLGKAFLPIREAKYGPYAPQDGWTEEDIELHKSIDWPSRNYFDYPVESDSFEGQAILYSTEFADGKKYVPATFIKYIRSNPLFPPYYAPKDMDKTGFVGPMYDGNNHGSYQIHDRYETEEIYRALSWD